MRLAFVLAASLVTAASHAASISYTGNFVQDDDLVTFGFDLASATTVTLRTWSFAGGTDAGGSAIPAGGFAPVLSLFDAGGSQDLLAVDRDGGSGPCGPRAVDPSSGFCWDAYLNLDLAAGSYLLVLTEDDNTPNGPTFADGFFQSGQGNFTAAEFGGPPGAQFILVDGSQRTSSWAVDLIGVAIPTPEPPPALLLLLCGAYIGVIASRLPAGHSRRRETME